jgi:RNA polymerase sigma-70 factor (ECF subfamily)
MFRSRLTQAAAWLCRFPSETSSFMDHSPKKRVFPGQRNVSPTVQAGSISLTAALADEAQSENAAIAHGLKKQNPELLDRLIDLYQHRLLRYLLFLTGKREVAEDLFQETWMRVLLRGSQYNGKARFDTWLFTIARNLVIDLSRKRTMASLDEMSEGGEDERPFEIAITGPSPLEQFQSREDSAEVGEVLLKLEPTYREVLVLRFYEELSLEEIAAVTKAPLSTVKSRLYRGLAALKPQMEQIRTSRPVTGAVV